MDHLIEWPEVLTEGHDIEECRSMLRDALREMILAYQQQGREMPAQERVLLANLIKEPQMKVSRLREQQRAELRIMAQKGLHCSRLCPVGA